MSTKLCCSKKPKEVKSNSFQKPAISIETFVFIGIAALFFGLIGRKMGGINLLNTLMNTSYELLISTVFYIMGIAVLAGAISGLLSEFGVIAMINNLLSPLMNPVYDQPGAAALGVVTTYLSDNPAILTLADDKRFRRYFKKYQLPALTNIGTAFGMGLIITTFMIGLNSPTGESFGLAALIGNLGAFIGSVISARIMLHFTKKEFGTTDYCCKDESNTDITASFKYRTVRQGSASSRAIEALLGGGKSGVDMGLAIIPGVLVICTLILIITNGPSEFGTYTGAAYEGVAFLPWLGEKLQFILTPLFGFSDPAAISVPITSLGAAGAAIGLVPKLVSNGIVHANDIAVFTAMCMCWSGYLSTHVAMMSGLKCSQLTGKAIFSHTIGGLCAGISANWLYQLTICIFF
ncbi:hypothetical protein QBE52_14215 [Clostridiaceae bacterium 35-E11]